MRKWRCAIISGLILLGTQPQLPAQDLPPGDDEAIIWPTVRYDWPAKLSAGVLFQPPFKGALDPLLGTFTIGTGGYTAGIGVGAVGGQLAVGYAVQLALTRTFEHPHGADPHQTFVGVEGALMIANIGVRVGPAFRIGGRTPSGNKFRMNVSVGLGF